MCYGMCTHEDSQGECRLTARERTIYCSEMQEPEQQQEQQEQQDGDEQG